MSQATMQPQAQAIKPILGSTFQWGYVVRDVQAAMRQWTEVMKVGPFIHIADISGLECSYHGKPTDPRLSNAFSYIGDMQIELIQQLNDAPSPYLDFVGSGREGLQHLGFWVEDYEGTRRSLEAAGFDATYSVRLPGARHATRYFDGLHMGAMTELSESTPQKTALYDAMKRLVRNWDGSRPIRSYATMGDFAKEQGVPSWS
jgi:hypothetical protein